MALSVSRGGLNNVSAQMFPTRRASTQKNAGDKKNHPLRGRVDGEENNVGCVYVCQNKAGKPDYKIYFHFGGEAAVPHTPKWNCGLPGMTVSKCAFL